MVLVACGQKHKGCILIRGADLLRRFDAGHAFHKNVQKNHGIAKGLIVEQQCLAAWKMLHAQIKLVHDAVLSDHLGQKRPILFAVVHDGDVHGMFPPGQFPIIIARSVSVIPTNYPRITVSYPRNPNMTCSGAAGNKDFLAGMRPDRIGQKTALHRLWRAGAFWEQLFRYSYSARICTASGEGSAYCWPMTPSSTSET